MKQMLVALAILAALAGAVLHPERALADTSRILPLCASASDRVGPCVWLGVRSHRVYRDGHVRSIPSSRAMILLGIM